MQKTSGRHLAAMVVFGVLAAQPARADYTYLHADSEYSVTLPDAPRGETVWADRHKIPFLDKPPKFGAMGEVSTFQRTDPTTGDYIKVDLKVIKADRDFLTSLTQTQTEKLLREEFKDVLMEASNVTYSPGAGTLRWATLTGFSVDKANTPLYHAGHFLTGHDSIFFMRAEYSIENTKLEEVYKEIVASIKFIETQ